MQDTQDTGNVTAPEQEVMETESSEPKSLDDIRQERLERLNPSAETEPEDTQEIEETAEDVDEDPVEESSIDAPEVEDDGSEEEEVQEGEEDVLSQIDWDALDDDTRSEIATQAVETLPVDKLAELAKKMGSGSGKRIGELTGQIKDLKSQIVAKDQALKEGIQQIAKPQSALADVSSQGDLDEAQDKIKSNIRFYQKWLGGDEEYFTHEGKDFSRQDVFKYVESLQDQYEDIPKQREYIRTLEKSKVEAEDLQKKAESEFTWLQDNDSKAAKLYDEMISSSDIAIIESIAPSVGYKLKYQLLHAANSMSGERSAPKGKKITLPRRLPSTARDSAAGSASPKTRGDVRVKKLRNAAKTGDLKAARELRTLEIQNKHSLFKRTT